MAREDIRSNGKNIPLTHHSARGRVQRNSGNFTRGSQLLTHEMLMWFSGARLPIMVWFFAFLAAWFVILSIRLDEHENPWGESLDEGLRLRDTYRSPEAI